MSKRKLLSVILLAFVTTLMLACAVIFTACGNNETPDDGQNTEQGGGNPQSETSPVAGEFVNDSGYYLNSDAYVIKHTIEFFTDGTAEMYVTLLSVSTGVTASQNFRGFYVWQNGKYIDLMWSGAENPVTYAYTGLTINTGSAVLTCTGKNSRDEFAGMYNMVSYGTSGPGKIEGEAIQYLRDGESTTSVTAVPSVGAEFVRWSDGVMTASRSDDDVKDNMSVYAEFRQVTPVFALSYSAGRGGSLTGETYQVVLLGESGTAVTAVPDSGYVFLGWSDGVATATRADRAVENMSVTAEFGSSYTITYAAGEGGSIQGETSQIVDEGATPTPVTAVPDEGYEFERWEYDVFGTTHYLWTPTITPTSQSELLTGMEYRAVFTKITYTATYNTNLGYRGGLLQYDLSENSGDKNPDDYKPEGNHQLEFAITIDNDYSAPIITAKAKDGYRFVQWSDGSNDPQRQDTNIHEDITITAEFVRVYNLTFVAGEGGSIQGETSQIVDEGATPTPVTAVPDEGYEFERWEYDVFGTTHYLWTPTITPTSQSELLTGMEYRAVFTKITYTATYNTNLGYRGGLLQYDFSENSGDKNPNDYKPEGKHFFEFAITIDNNYSAPIITAKANNGYRFVQWSDGSTDPQRQDTDIHEDITITAEFVRVYNLTFTAGGGGTIQGETSQIVDEGATPTSVTAVPDEGYEFERWEYDVFGTTHYFWSPTITPTSQSELLTEMEYRAVFTKISK